MSDWTPASFDILSATNNGTFVPDQVDGVVSGAFGVVLEPFEIKVGTLIVALLVHLRTKRCLGFFVNDELARTAGDIASRLADWSEYDGSDEWAPIGRRTMEAWIAAGFVVLPISPQAGYRLWGFQEQKPNTPVC